MTKNKVLVIANNCFEKSNSNGRTLANLFNNLEKENIAQFYISGNPDFTICNNYFKVSDENAVKSFLTFKQCYGEQKIKEGTISKIKQTNDNKIKRKKNFNLRTTFQKTPLALILRNYIWKTKRWRGNSFNDWINKFDPNIVLLQVANSSFMCELAMSISKERNIPLYLYNTEAFYFKKYNHMQPSDDFLEKEPSLWFKIYLKEFKNTLKKTIDHANASIYLCDKLKKDYDKEFNKPSYVIYNSSSINIIDKKAKAETLKFSYLGNLGLKRVDSLVEIANTIAKIDNNIIVDIYGKEPSEEDLLKLNNCKHIKYHGFLSYNEVIKTIEKSDVLLGVESFLPFYVEDTKYAFSGKIADSLNSKRLFFVYAPETTAISEYLKLNDVGVVANNKNELFDKLNLVINDEEYREKVINKQINIAKENHNLEKNSNEFLNILFNNK